jgi:hypothetical protein
MKKGFRTGYLLQKVQQLVRLLGAQGHMKSAGSPAFAQCFAKACPLGLASKRPSPVDLVGILGNIYNRNEFNDRIRMVDPLSFSEGGYAADAGTKKRQLWR